MISKKSKSMSEDFQVNFIWHSLSPCTSGVGQELSAPVVRIPHCVEGYSLCGVQYLWDSDQAIQYTIQYELHRWGHSANEREDNRSTARSARTRIVELEEEDVKKARYAVKRRDSLSKSLAQVVSCEIKVAI